MARNWCKTGFRTAFAPVFPQLSAGNEQLGFQSKPACNDLHRFSGNERFGITRLQKKWGTKCAPAVPSHPGRFRDDLAAISDALATLSKSEAVAERG